MNLAEKKINLFLSDDYETTSIQTSDSLDRSLLPVQLVEIEFIHQTRSNELIDLVWLDGS